MLEFVFFFHSSQNPYYGVFRLYLKMEYVRQCFSNLIDKIIFFSFCFRYDIKELLKYQETSQPPEYVLGNANLEIMVRKKEDCSKQAK